MNAVVLTTKLEEEEMKGKLSSVLEDNNVIVLPVSLYTESYILRVIKQLGNAVDLMVSYPSRKEFATKNLEELEIPKGDKHIYLLQTIKFIPN